MNIRAVPDMRRRMTLKQRKTAACTAGDTGTVRRHSDNRSKQNYRTEAET